MLISRYNFFEIGEILKNIKELFEDCKQELYNIGIDCENDCDIDIGISKRNNKRYGCCKPEEPDKATKYYIYIKRKRNKKFVKKREREHVKIRKDYQRL